MSYPREPLRPITILLADDNEDDRLMTSEALAESGLTCDLRQVEDGEMLMDYLHQRGAYTRPGAAPRPSLILLDLNMPRKSGHEALQEIRSDPVLRRTPVIVLTTSQAEKDVVRSYDLGVNSFISKPVTFPALVEVMKSFARYWIHSCAIPPAQEDA